MNIQNYYQIFSNTSSMFMCDMVVKKMHNSQRQNIHNQTTYSNAMFKISRDPLYNQNKEIANQTITDY